MELVRLGGDVSNALLPTYARADLAFERGEGAWLITADGQKYLDFASGIAVTALGHAHPILVAALREQAGKFWHCSNIFRIPGQERLAERLVARCFADRVFFTNSGAEAVECGIKMVRMHFDAVGDPDRYRIITFEGAFHGRTLTTVAAGGNPKHLEGFDPPVDGFDQVPFGDIAAVKSAIGPKTAAILIEPVQGEGGIRVASRVFLTELRALCDARGLLLFFDEVQCGMGRTGKLFAYEWSGITPDIMALAKGIGGGFPVGACLATERAASGMTAGSHGSTYGGNPLAMAVGNAILDVMLADGFLARVERMANYMRQQLSMLADQNPKVIEEVRGLGLLMGLKCRIKNTDLLLAMREQKLLAVGASDNVVRLLPPLIISEAEIGEAVARINRACESVQP
jgi:acetylornithine/N-succinyldiaminopimelate aminotransferase